MAVRLIIGRAGTGKTALCVREIRAEMQRDPLGPPLLWLAPEQGTFAAERLLLTGSGAGLSGGRGSEADRAVPRGTFRAQVLSFRRLALLIARETGALPAVGDRAAKPMDEVARVVLLEEMVRQLKPQLTVFASVAERPGFVRKLDATLRELRQHGHSGDSLRALVDQAKAGLDAVMVRKVLDLATLLDAWSQVVARPDAWDFEYVMHHAALAMKSSRMIAGSGDQGGARVWVDAMSAMSGLEIRMLAELGRVAGEVTITLLADPDSPALQDMRAGAEAGGLFARTERLHRRLIDAFRRHDVTMAETVPLRGGHRFTDPMLRRVEAELLDEGPATAATSDASAAAQTWPAHAAASPAAMPARGKKKRQADQGPSLFDALETAPAVPAFTEPRAAQRPPESPGPGPGAGGVEIWEASDPETEVRSAAQAIREMVTAPAAGSRTLRYRQIAVIVPDLDDAGGGGASYQDALRRIFAEHQIPHFIDARRGMAHHPLVELVRSAVAVVTSHFERDEMLLLLKTQLVGIAPADVALLENYAIEHGVTHVPWDAPWTWIAPNQRQEDADERVPLSAYQRLAQVNAIRERAWASLNGFVQKLEQKPAEDAPDDARRFALALRELLASLGVEHQLNAWSAHEKGAGNSAELAQVHAQVWRAVDRLLTLLATILADRPRTLEEFERLLATALQSLTLGLIPPTVDQVLVSSVTRSRVPEMEVVIILGAVEGQFPKVLSEDPILSDAQREAFNALAADPIGEGAGRQLMEMPFFDYVALTRARRRLIVSYPLADRQGKALGRSRHVTGLRALLGARRIERRFNAQSRTEIDRISTADDLLAGVTSWAREIAAHGASDAGSDTALMPAAYNWLVKEAPADLAEARQRIWRCVGTRPAPAISPAIAAGFFPPRAALQVSISKLEEFAACPLQYFAHYTLGLQPRAEFQLDALSLGSLQHAILEGVYRRLIKGELDWPMCTPEQVRALLTEEIDRTIQEEHAELAQRTPGYEKMRLRLIRVLGIMLEADRRRAMQGEMRPVAVELYFGQGKEPQYQDGRLISLPVLEVPGRDRPIQISGKIDRVDEPESGDPEAVVIDYKSAARKSMDLGRVLRGIALQLPAYALVLRHLAHRDPIAALYVPLGLWLELVEHGDRAPNPDDDGFFQKLRPRGIGDAQLAWKLDRLLAPEEHYARRNSPWFQMRFTKEGDPYSNADLLRHDDFNLLLAYTAWKISALGSELAAGVIAPAPYRKGQEIPCKHCDYASICPFDPARDLFREVTRVKRDAAVAQMRASLAPQAT